MITILSVGLESGILDELSALAKDLKYNLLKAHSFSECSMTIGHGTCDLIIYAVNSAQREEWPVLSSLGTLPGSPDCIATVPSGDTEAAEHALQAGAWDIISQPYPFETLKISLNRCLYHRMARHSQMQLGDIAREGIVGDSPLLERCLRQMSIVAKSDSSVLILGETGTGKELFARAVHENSPRASKPLIVVDCTNLPATLAESILFGHAKGSFTGAVESTEGLFKQADGGTIFLDEIGELDLNVQKSLLRVIQERRFRPLSAKKEIQCDFRIIAATNRDLDEMVHKGTFRQDLYHRINTRSIILPALRDRVEDIPKLATYFTDMFCRNLGCSPKQMANETVEALKLYNWPGNVREIVNVVHATVLNGIVEQRLYPQHLPEDIRRFLIRAKISGKDLAENAAASGNAHWLAPSPSSSASNAVTSIVPGEAALAGGTLCPPVQQSAPPAAARSAPLISNPSPAKTDNPLFSDNQMGNLSISAGASDGGQFSFNAIAELPPLRNVREELIGKMEYSYLTELIRRSSGNFTQALQLSGLSRARLYELLQKHLLTI